ncbi:MAG: cysteine desulfurase NifS [Planctomycetes bacterium]|nr:cysteine desulfurase NifS [Planctomycetota bacterium]
MDNNATTAVDAEVLQEMLPFFSERYGNPSSIHNFGGGVGKKIDEARCRLAGLIGARPDEIIFTASGSESDNTAIRSAIATNADRRHLVISKVEHPAVLNLARHLVTGGFRVTEIGVDAMGRIDLDELSSSLTDDTAVVSIMWANNETGNIYPIERIGALCRERGILFHTDAVQAVGRIPMRLSELPVDLLSLSGHKLHAPKGIGALYVRRAVRFEALVIGGHQEGGRRAGTENVPGIVGLGKAAELAAERIPIENSMVRALRDRLESSILASCPDVSVNGDPENRLPNTCNISFGYIEGEAILLSLDIHGICASSGSACTSGSLEPSHVLRAMGVPFTSAHGSVRFSLSVQNSDADVDRVIQVMPGIVAKLRAMSPFSPEAPYFQNASQDTCPSGGSCS